MLINKNEKIPDEFFVFVNFSSPIAAHNYKIGAYTSGVCSTWCQEDTLAKYLDGSLNYLPFEPSERDPMAVSHFCLTAINDYRIEYDAEIYRKHNNPLVDFLQYHGRNRSNKYMIDKRNAKALLMALEDKELCLYLPDQDYGPKQSVFVPFGGVAETATTTATLMFIRRSTSVPMMITSQYTAKGYKIKIYPPLTHLGEMEDIAALTELNTHIDKAIKEQPESYLWMHKRFKTRPSKDTPSLY